MKENKREKYVRMNKKKMKIKKRMKYKKGRKKRNKNLTSQWLTRYISNCYFIRFNEGCD